MKNLQQIPNVRSPTESVDSGVGLSPCSNAYGSSDDLSTSVVDNLFDSLSELTPDELERLSNGCVSPASSGESCLDDLTDINHFELITGEEIQDSEVAYLGAGHVVEHRVLIPVENTNVVQSNRRKRKIRSQGQECYKDSATDRCFVPKSGTSKPRQSHKKNKTGNANKKVMKPTITSGARVKITARERLAEIRSSSKSGGSQSSANPCLKVESQQYSVLSGTLSQYGSVTSNSSQVASASHIRHSVQQILHSTSQPHVPLADDAARHHEPDGLQDGLEPLITKSLQYGNADDLILYFRTNRTQSECGGTIFHSIMVKLNQRKDLFAIEQMENLTKVLCDRLPSLINSRNLRGETPLFQAALHGNIGSLRALMGAGADPWIQENSVNKSSLDAAIWSKNPEAVDIIIDNVEEESCRTGINRASWDGNTPLHRATALREIDLQKQRKIISVLLGAGADPSSKNSMSEMPHTLLPPELRDLQEQMRRMNSRRRAHTSHHHRINALQTPTPAFIHPQLQASYHPSYPNIIPPAFSMPLPQTQSFSFSSALQSPNIFSSANPAFTQAMDPINSQFNLVTAFPQMGNTSSPNDFSVEDEFLDSIVNEGQ